MMSKSVRYILIILGIIIINLIGDSVFRRIDLTEEKRYSLSEVSKTTVDSLAFPLQVSVYMEGNFPPNVRTFYEGLKTTLIELDQYSGGKLDYEFVTPNTELENEFLKRGFFPLEVDVKVSNSERKKQRIWPLIQIKYRENETFIDLLRGATIMTPAGPTPSFLKAEADIEYKLISGIRKLVKNQEGVILFIEGHGEKRIESLPEFKITLENNGYRLARFNMNNPHAGKIPKQVDVAIIIQPEKRFSERHKYEIDQFILSGGCVFWVMDNEVVDMDIFEGRSSYSQLRSLNLDDMFFQYGFKINYDLVQDLSCATIEVFQEEGARGKITSAKWVFYPETFVFPQHPISRNVDLAMARYPSSIDTLPVQGIVERSVFYQSSPQSRSAKQQQFINIEAYTKQPLPTHLFNEGPKILGLLSEGVYTSLFKGRDIPLDSLSPNAKSMPFIEKNELQKPGKIVVISDGDFISPKLFRGKSQTQDGKNYPMPPDNKILLLNAIDYLSGDVALTKIRSKEVIIRVLDEEKIKDRTTIIQIINIGIPLIVLVLFGFIRSILRKRKNSNLSSSKP